MKTVGFIGAYDKTDLILYVAKIMIGLKRRVLLIDSTITQKSRYVVPVIGPTKSYVTEFEGIDVAVGFDDFKQIEQYINAGIEESYDVILIDVDSIEIAKNFNLQPEDKKYFVTSFDIYSLRRGIEIIKELEIEQDMTKILYSRDMLREEEEYLDYLTLGMNVKWNSMKICFPLNFEDISVIQENQRSLKISLKKLSSAYRDNLMIIVEDILENVSMGEIKKAIKMMEKDVF